MNPAAGAGLLLSFAVAFAHPSQTPGVAAQSPATEAAHAPLAPNGLESGLVERVQRAIDARDYRTAEQLLLDQINLDPHSRRAALLLDWISGIYLQDHDAMNAAIALTKSNAITPLDPRLQFSLAMAYISIQRPDWARLELQKLSAADPKNALYPYWLGRLDYDGHFYPSAMRHFQHAIELDPAMARAYDNLGLVYFYQNQNQLAVDSFRKAIELDRNNAHPSAWPYLNLAITEQFLNQNAEAEAHLRKAIDLDASLPQAHFHLGTIMEDSNRLKEAVEELKTAAQLDPSYPEPHMALARVYHKLDDEGAARNEVEIYKRLHSPSAPQK